MLAADASVGGVERRDPGTLGGTSSVELWAYTTPPQVETVVSAVVSLADTMQLTVTTAVELRDDDDWRDSWKQFYPPRVVGDGALLLRPSWVERRPTDPAREVVIDPGRAFGTGLHESTQLCLDRLCALHAEAAQSPEVVLDLGCGSGILGLAAVRLFPSARVWAIDFDPEAVETTRENVEHNGLQDRFTLQTGIVDDLDAPQAQLVLANIRPSVLIPAAASIRARVAPGGRAVLSGILIEEAPAVRAAYQAQGLDVVDDDAVRGEWQSVELRAP